MLEEFSLLNIGSDAQTFQVSIHPLIPLSILEFSRRKKEEKFVMGCLLGNVHPNKIEITNCYQIPFMDFSDKESFFSELITDKRSNVATITINKLYHVQMFELHKRVFENEIIIGFFVTQQKLDFNIQVILEYFQLKESKFAAETNLLSPLILTIDPNFTEKSCNLKLYQNIPQPFLNDCFGIFQPLNYEIQFCKEQQSEIQPLLKHTNLVDRDGVNNYNIDSMGAITAQLIKNISLIQSNIVKAKENTSTDNSQAVIDFGKELKKLVSELNNYFKMISATAASPVKAQEIALASCLANLANSQALVAEKLNQI